MVIGRIDALEMKSNDLGKKNESLHWENVELQKMVKDLTTKLEVKEAEYNKVAVSQVGSIVNTNNRISNLEENDEAIQQKTQQKL